MHVTANGLMPSVLTMLDIAVTAIAYSYYVLCMWQGVLRSSIYVCSTWYSCDNSIHISVTPVGRNSHSLLYSNCLAFMLMQYCVGGLYRIKERVHVRGAARYRSGSGDAKNRKHWKYAGLILFMRCGGNAAAVWIFKPFHGAIHAVVGQIMYIVNVLDHCRHRYRTAAAPLPHRRCRVVPLCIGRGMVLVP